MSTFWKLEKYGVVALSICLTELAGIWIPLSIAVRYPKSEWAWLNDPFAALWFAGLLSIPISIVGLFRDDKRMFAFPALILGLVNIVICGAPLAV